MIRQYRYALISIALVCSMVWAACTQQRQPCLTPKIASLIMETMHLPTDTATIFIDTALTSAVFIPISTNSNTGIVFPLSATFTISLSPDGNRCQWLMATDTLSQVFDTLTFYYKSQLQFLSNACGYTDFFNLDSVHTTHKNIDSIHIINASVTNNVNTKHLQVFIHPDF